MKLTIGMPSFNNYKEVWFTLQALRTFQDLDDVELLVIDNYGDDNIRKFIQSWLAEVTYVRYTGVQSPAAAKNKVFEMAQGE